MPKDFLPASIKKRIPAILAFGLTVFFRMGSERLIVTPEQEEIATMYEHALALYRKGDFDGAEMAFDHVMSLNPSDGPSRLMKSRIAKYRTEYAGAESHFDPVYKFDELRG